MRSGKAAACETEERVKGRSPGPRYRPAVPSPAARWGALGDCRGPLQSAPGPWRVPREEPGALLHTGARAAARLDLRREGPSFPFPKTGFTSGQLLRPTILLWPACVQTAWPEKSAPHGTGPPQGPVPHPPPPPPLIRCGPNERAFTQECAQPGRGPGPQQPCNLMNCQHLGRNCWALD